MTTVTLFGFQGSGSAAIEAALQRAGIAYRSVNAASWEPASALDELRRVNPLLQIPTLLLPDGSVLTESAAILIHLGLTHPSSGLLPADASLRAQAIRGLVFIAANCYSAISILDYPERWVAEPDESVNDRVRRGTKARLHYHWELFADMVADKPFFTSEPLGGLEILATVVSRWSGTRAHLRAVRPEFLARLERIESHPAVAPVFARHWPA